MDEVPLDEAVAQGLIPCAGCGAKGAAVKRVDGRPHFLCPKCAGGKATAWVGTLVAVVVFAVAAWWLMRGTSTPAVRDPLAEVERLSRAGKLREARVLLEARVKAAPEDPRLLFDLARGLLDLGYVDAALAAFRKIVEMEPASASLAGLWIGICLQKLGLAAEALPQLQTPIGNANLEALRRGSLAECLLDLERYDDLLQQLEGGARDARRIWARYRALRYSGREKQAEEELQGVDPRETWTFQVTRLREDGDFDGALRLIETRRKEAPAERFKLARSELAVAVEAGDAPRMLALADLMAAAPDPQLRVEGILNRAVARRILGQPEEARAAAEAWLSSTDPDLSAQRLDRLQMLRLAGKSTDADLEAEAKRVSRFRSNDLYWFLAVVTGDKAWAEKGLAATPGRNFPYHALKRFAGK